MGIAKTLAKAGKKVSKVVRDTAEQKGSIATRTSTSKTAIDEAKTLKDVSVARSQIKQMEDPELRKFFLAELKKKENKIRAKQAKEKDLAGRKSAQAASDRKAKPVTLPKTPFAKGGLTKPSASQSGLKKLPTAVRNKMGYMKSGGKVTKGHVDMRKGGLFR